MQDNITFIAYIIVPALIVIATVNLHKRKI
jgi:hypothetical protein